MERSIPLGTLACGYLLLAGCASTSYNIGIDSYTAQPPSQIPPGATFSAVASSGGNVLLDQEVQGKIGQLMMDRDFSIVPAEEAEYLILALFGIGDPQTVSTGGVVLPVGNMLAYVPRSATTYFRWLLIGVAEAEQFRTQDLTTTQIPWLWLGQTSSAGSSDDLRHVIDYLLVPTFETFGQSTARRIEVTLKEDDERVNRLRRGS